MLSCLNVIYLQQGKRKGVEVCKHATTCKCENLAFLIKSIFP